MRATVTINAQGRMTVPAEIRRELGIEGEATLLIETEAGRMIVRPAVVIAAEDAWAYSPEHRARFAAALADVQAGRVLHLGEGELLGRMRLAPASGHPAEEDVDEGGIGEGRPVG